MDTTQESPSGLPGSDYTPSLDDLGPEEQLPQKPEHDAATDGFAPETVDLVATLGDADQQKLADEVIRAYERDWKGSERFRERRTSIVKLFLGMLPPVDDADGSIGGARVHYPIIATAINRMHARVYDQQFPSNGEFFGVKPMDATDLERAVRVAKHLNWQIMHQIPEYVMNHDVLIMQWLLYGSAFSYIYWDPVKSRPCHEVCRTEDIVLPYTFQSTDPSLSDVPRITRIVRKYQHEIDDLADVGYYQNIDLVQEREAESGTTGSSGGGGFMANVSSSTGGQTMDEVMQKAQGVDKPAEDSEGSKDGPRVLLEQHRWWKLPGDKKSRPIVATVDKATKILIGLRLREDEDPQDRARYNREKAAIRASYDAAMQQYQMNMVQYVQQFGPPQPPMGAEPPQDATEPPETSAQSMTEPPEPGETTSTMPGFNPMQPPAPEPPQQPADPTPPRMVAINFFTHFVCIPNPEGIYGFGIGYLLEGHNMVADTIASQIVDAGTLANTSTFFYSRQARMRRGDLRIKPGEGVEVDLAPQDLDKGIKMLEFKGPDPQLAAFIKDQKEEAAELSGANEILSGEVGGSNETATTTQIRISQALTAISILNKRYTRARTFEGQKLARLNSVHLDDVEYFTVVDPLKTVPPTAFPPGQLGTPPQTGTAPPGAPPPGGPGLANQPGPTGQSGPGQPAPPQPTPGPQMINPPAPLITEQYIGRIDYLEDVDITVTADPRMASQPQRVEEAQGIVNALNQDPVIAQMMPLKIAAYRNLFIAMDRPELVAALQQSLMMPPPGPPGGPGAPPAKSGAGGGAPQPNDKVPNGPPNAVQNGPSQGS